MLNIDIFEDFIAVGARKGISKYGSAILNEDFSSGMSGYDVEDMVKQVISKNDSFTDILNHFSFDSEYSMFCMYYRHEGIKSNVKTTDEMITKCNELVTIINNLIANEYIAQLSNVSITPIISDIRK